MKTYKLNIKIPKELQQLNSAFKKERIKLYVVGGAVRDALQNKQPKDWDIVTELTPDKVIKLLYKYNIKTVDKDFKFGIIRAYIGNEEFEIATTRKDIGKGRRPDSVEFTSLKDDASRRDLTINSLYYDIEKKEVIDYFGGVEDIKQLKVNTVGNPTDRFEEDALRKLRTIRFAARTNSKLEPIIVKSLKSDNSLPEVSNERILDEFLKIIKQSTDIKYGLNLLNEFDFFNYIFKDLLVDLNVIDKINTKNPNVIIASLLQSNDTKVLPNKLNKLKYSNEQIKNIVFLISLINFKPTNIVRINRLKQNLTISDEDILKFAYMNNLDINLIKQIIKYEYNDGRATRIATKLGIKQGKEYGEFINKLEAKVLQKIKV